MGLWETRPVGVCDRCGERWDLSSGGFEGPCPSCGSMDSGRFGRGVQRNCWDCGAVWKAPPPTPEKTRLRSLGEAIVAAAMFVFAVVVVLVGLFMLVVVVVWAGVLIYATPALLVPLGLFLMLVALFYLLSRRAAKKDGGDEGDPSRQGESSADATPGYPRPVGPARPLYATTCPECRERNFVFREDALDCFKCGAALTGAKGAVAGRPGGRLRDRRDRLAAGRASLRGEPRVQ